MNKKINKLLALSAAFVMSGCMTAALAACGGTDDETPNGGTEPVQLSAPSISLNQNVVSWQAVEHATGYEVTVGSNTPVQLSGETYSYMLTMTEPGSYRVTVAATSTDENYTKSAQSNAVTYVVEGGTVDPTPSDKTALAAPVIEVDGNLVTWQAVTNATGYLVTVGENDAVAVTTTEYEIIWNTADVGSFDVTVVATTTNDEYTNSPASNVGTFTRRLVQLTAATEGSDVPAKTKYYLDEQATEIDLTGLSLKGVYSDAGECLIDNDDLTVSPANALATTGTKQITVSLGTGTGVRTKVFEITVKERSVTDLIADDIEYTSVQNEYSATATEYKIADTEVDGAVTMTGRSLQVIKHDGKSFIPASEFTSSGSLLVKIQGGGSAFVNVIAAQFITTAAQLQAINENLDGYYILQNDISLDGFRIANNSIANYWAKGFTPIGSAPLKGTGETDNDPVTLDLSGTGTYTQEGRAFTGTFDGNGHVIEDMLVFFPDEAAYKYTAYYLGMFGYIGETGIVKNFTLRNATVRGGQSSSLIAGVNLGVIENVTIEDDCKLFVNYADDRGCGYAADYNNGTIRNIVCHASEFTYRNGNLADTAVKAVVDEQTGTVTNCYVGDSTDLTETLGDGWTYIDGVGTYYGTELGKVLAHEQVVYVGQTFDVTLYNTSAVTDIEFLADWTANDDAPTDVPVLEVKSSNDNVYTIGFADDVTSELFATVKMFRIGVRVGTGENAKYIDSFYVTVGDPYITGISDITQNITCENGGNINLGAITLTLTKSDGTTTTANPTGIKGEFDNTTDGEKQVTFVYTVGENTFEKTTTVTVVTSEAVINAALKQGVTKVIVPYSDGWSLNNVDWAEYLTVTDGTDALDGYTVTVTGSVSGASRTLTISKEGYADDFVNVDVYLGVGSAAAYSAINNDLAGWYILTNDIDFAGAAITPIGGIPLQQDDNGTEFNSETANVQGLAFTGIFDGNNKTLSNMYLWEPFSIAWTQDHFGGMFGYIGETGVVKNFTLSGVKFNSVNYTSFVAGYSQGMITGITVNSDCTIYANYGAAGAFAYVNAGVINNCTCYVTTFTKTGDVVNDLQAVNSNYGNGLDEDTVKVIAATESGSSL